MTDIVCVMNGMQLVNGHVSGSCSECQSRISGKCSQRVHDAMAAMLGESSACIYLGHLFNRSYPSFESLATCRQYIREYLPFHLTQIENGLLAAYKEIKPYLPEGRPVRVLDVGAGPASVALALERLVESGRLTGRFIVDAIEPSASFVGLIRLVQNKFRFGPVQINEIYEGDLTGWLIARKGGLKIYDWIVAANCLSPMGLSWKAEEIALLYRHAIDRVTYGSRGFVTIIEGGCSTYINPYVCMDKIEKSPLLEKVAGTSGVGRMTPCGFYRTKWGNDRPNMIMLTMKAAA